MWMDRSEMRTVALISFALIIWPSCKGDKRDEILM